MFGIAIIHMNNLAGTMCPNIKFFVSIALLTLQSSKVKKEEATKAAGIEGLLVKNWDFSLNERSSFSPNFDPIVNIDYQ